jgi:hypothetical protein
MGKSCPSVLRSECFVSHTPQQVLIKLSSEGLTNTLDELVHIGLT